MSLAGGLMVKLAKTFSELPPNWDFLHCLLLQPFLLKCQTCRVVWSLPFLLWLSLSIYPSEISWIINVLQSNLPWYLLLEGHKLTQKPNIYQPYPHSWLYLSTLFYWLFNINPISWTRGVGFSSHNIIPLPQISARTTFISNTISPHLYLTSAICTLLFPLS